MGVLQAVKNGFLVTTKNLKLWVLLVVISIVLMIVAMPIGRAVFGTAFQPGVAPTPEQMADVNWGLFILFIAVMMLVQIFVNAGVVVSIKDIVKTGSLNLNNFVAYAKKFFVRFLLFSIIMLLAMLGVGVIFMLLGALVGAVGNWVNFLGMLLGIVVFLAFVAAIILLAMYGGLGPVAIAAEDKGLFECMGLALNFIKERLKKVVGLFCALLLIFLGALGVFLVISFIVGMVAGISRGGAVQGLSPGTQTSLDIVLRVVWNLIGTYLTLVSISSLMSYYVGNAGVKAPSPETPQV